MSFSCLKFPQEVPMYCDSVYRALYVLTRPLPPPWSYLSLLFCHHVQSHWPIFSSSIASSSSSPRGFFVGYCLWLEWSFPPTFLRLKLASCLAKRPPLIFLSKEAQYLSHHFVCFLKTLIITCNYSCICFLLFCFYIFDDKLLEHRGLARFCLVWFGFYWGISRV